MIFSRKNNLVQIVLIGTFIGIAFACYLFTKYFFAGETSFLKWPQGDIEMFTTGGEYFIHDTWHFPFFLTSMIQRSYMQSLVFTDCVPLFALLAKVIYTLSGHEIQFLAWWYAVLVVMQPVSFAFLMWAGGIRNKRLIAIGSAFSVLVPAWLYRIGHSALFGHFTILTAMALYFASVNSSKKEQKWPRWLLITWPVWLMVCATINIYLLAMAFLFFVAALAQLAWKDSERHDLHHFRPHILYTTGVLACVVVILYVFGFFVPYQGGGEFGIHSTNLLSPFVPQLTTLFTDSLKIVDATGGQYEGYNYLGAGFWGLILLAVSFGDGRGLREMKTQPFLIVLLCCLFFFALSTVGYAGNYKLWSIHAPGLFKIFRSSGRFIWPVSYFCLFQAFYALEPLLTSPKAWRAFIVIMACLLLQWQDMRYLSDGLYNIGHGQDKPALNTDPEEFRHLIGQHKGVFIVPDFACAKSKKINDTITDIGLYAALENKPVNTIYFARAPVDFDCKIEWPKIDEHLNKDYLVMAFFEKRPSDVSTGGLTCKQHDNLTVCMGSKRVKITDDMLNKALLSF